MLLETKDRVKSCVIAAGGRRKAEGGRQKAEGGKRGCLLPSAFRFLPSPLSGYS
jgi:hypothetical protein